MTEQLDLKTTYRAILDAARDKRFISYGGLATANDANWHQYRMFKHLDDLVEIAAKRDWPMLTAIVVSKENLETGILDGNARDGFIRAAEKFGFVVSDPANFVKKQQDNTFSWARTAPDDLVLAEDEQPNTRISSGPQDEPGDLFEDANRRFWFVGSHWGDDDQAERFYQEGTWQNGRHPDKYAERVARMQSGDYIALKSTFTKKYDVPFENRDLYVSCMRIKAIGTVTQPTKDGWTVNVKWRRLNQPREWYFYTYRVTIVESNTDDTYARRLIRFTFGGHEQDYEYWLRQPYWASRYGAHTPAPTGTDPEDDDIEPDEAEITPYGVDDILEDGCFLSREALDSALSRLEDKSNLILQGPPGTGKTWLAKRLGYALVGTKDRAVIRKRMRSIQFHPSLSYEDFVRGWRPDGDGQLSLIDGVFLEAVETARAEPDRPFVVIIEEINRGNPAQIFGEMLTLLEKDKRSEEEAIELAYRRNQGERVFIPRNLFVIGTMNIADRSLALVDLALRRRFAFVTLETALNESWRNWCMEQSGIEEATLNDIRTRMMELNEQIAADRSLGAQFKIGHSYVTPARDEEISDARAWFRGIVETEIGPLLEEYWFDSLDKAELSTERLLQGL